jgi:hypothetical protein
MKAGNIIKILIIFLFLLIGCSPLPKEGSDVMEVKMELKYDNETRRLTAIYFTEE